MRRSIWRALALSVVLVAPAAAQSTLMPDFSVPYRAFVDNEKGIGVSFPGGTTAFEGVYGIGRGIFDVRFRGGFLLESASNDLRILFGSEFRTRVITHTEDFPADGAIVFGGGVQLGETNILALPIGLALGRRLDVENSEVVIVPFVQPTGVVVAGDTSDFLFSLGFGADFRLTRSFDLRVSLGLGDVDGLSMSAVWIH